MTRLSLIASLIPPCRRLVDIGSDHAAVPIALLGRGVCQRAVITDIRKGPLDVARRRVEAAGLSDRCGFILSDGLDRVDLQEGDVLLISGLGGENIAGIVERGYCRLAPVRRMILQPQTKEEALRSMLNRLGISIADEQAAVEDRRPYLAVVCGRVSEPSGAPLTPLQLQFGPVILDRAQKLLPTCSPPKAGTGVPEAFVSCDGDGSFTDIYKALQSLSLSSAVSVEDRARLVYLTAKIDKINRRSRFHPDDKTVLAELLSRLRTY